MRPGSARFCGRRHDMMRPDATLRRRSTMAIRLIDRLSELAPRYDGFILDLWGVIHDGAAPLPGAIECLAALRSRDVVGGGGVAAPRPPRGSVLCAIGAALLAYRFRARHRHARGTAARIRRAGRRGGADPQYRTRRLGRSPRGL